MILYRVVWLVVTGVTRLLWRPRVRGRENIPATGACILAPSHRSIADIPLLACATRRRIRYMGKREVFDVPVLGQLFSALGSFAVARDGDDRAALRAALTILERDGEPMAVYPEGTRQHGREIAELQPGAAYLAIRAGIPIVPVGIAGSEEIMRAEGSPERRLRFPSFHRTAVVVGEPIQPPDRAGRAVKRALVNDLTERLGKDLSRLIDEAYSLID